MANILFFSRPSETLCKTGGCPEITCKETYSGVQALADELCEKNIHATLWLCPLLYEFNNNLGLYVQDQPIDLFVIRASPADSSVSFWEALRSKAWGGAYQKTPVIFISQKVASFTARAQGDARTTMLTEEKELQTTALAQTISSLLPLHSLLRYTPADVLLAGPYGALDEHGLVRPLTPQDGTHPLYEKVASLFRPGPR